MFRKNVQAQCPGLCFSVVHSRVTLTVVTSCLDSDRRLFVSVNNESVEAFFLFSNSSNKECVDHTMITIVA
jgi:hypothetical protein